MKRVFVVACVLALSACAGSNNGQAIKSRPGTPDSIDGQISEAVRISDGMSRQVIGSGGTSGAIASVKNVKTIDESPVPVAGATSSGGTDATPPGVVLSPDAVQPITVTWNGELESFLANVASRGGYVFKVSGRRPATPMNIAIVADEEPMFGVVRRAGNMAQGYADVVFNPSAKLIEIRYRG